MNQGNIASILVALISAGFAYASSRAASKATKFHDLTSARLEVEKDAYDRARKFDVDTIDRQDKEIDKLRQRETQLVNDIVVLKIRVRRLEQLLPAKVKEKLDEEDRERDID